MRKLNWKNLLSSILFAVLIALLVWYLYANRADLAAIEAALGQEELVEGDLSGMTIEDEDGEVILPETEEYDDSYDEE